MSTIDIAIPPKLIPVFTTPGLRYRGAKGGRGSAKTRTFATMIAVRAHMLARAGRKGHILCGREMMNSLSDSSMEEIKQVIYDTPYLRDKFRIGEKFIRTRCGRVKFLFAGLRHNLDSIKSKARVLLTWIDEAETISEMAWRKLAATVLREPGSEIWVTWNPERDGSPTDLRFVKAPPSDCMIVEMNYWDNPWFPEGLEKERRDDLIRLDDATYRWIWEGAYLERSDALVMGGKYRMADFVPSADWGGPYFGLDWGFANDPTAGVKLWIADQRLYVEHDGGKVGLENDDIAKFMIAKLPDVERHVVRADNSRPETISHVRSPGDPRAPRPCLPRLRAAAKWPGSVEDGIAHLRSYKEVIIHPRAAGTIAEARKWSYKVDRLTGDVLPDLVDADNHYWDATRYALQPIIRPTRSLFG